MMMFGKIFEKFWNRRKEIRRIILKLEVNITDLEGEPYKLISEDVSDWGIRLHFEETRISRIVGHREEVPLEIYLQDGISPVEVQANLLWVYDDIGGGSVSGWRFVHFKGNSHRQLMNYLDHCEAQL